jgi:hypothetical protein
LGEKAARAGGHGPPGWAPAREGGEAVGEVIHAGQRVRLRVDALGFRAGQSGRVARVESRRRAGARVVLYFCAMEGAAGRPPAPLFPEEIEPLD